MGNESTMTVRKHALSFCSGVILSFLIIGVALIIFKEAGTSLGWGFQLQSPAIVSMLSLIMFIIRQLCKSKFLVICGKTRSSLNKS